MLAIIVSRNVGNYNFPKYWQLKISERLATIFIEMLATNVSNTCSKVATDVKKIIFENTNNYIFQKIAIAFFGNAGDKC